MNNEKWRLIIGCCLLWIMPALGAEVVTNFSSDSMQCSKKLTDYVCIYSGNAELVQGDNQLTAPKIVTYQNAKHEIYQVIAEGAPARYHTADAKKVVDANAKTIKFYPLKNFITFIDQAEIIENNTKFTGQYIDYDLTKKTIVSRPNDKIQTTIVIQPSS